MGLFEKANSDNTNNEQTNFNEKLSTTELDATVLENNLSKIAYTLDKDYLTHLDDYSVCKFEKYCEIRGIKYIANETKNFMAIKISKFIINKEEKIIDCMKNIIGSFSNSSDSLGFLAHRKIDCVDLYFIFKKDGEIKRDIVKDKLELLKKSFEGNFEGSLIEEIVMDSEVNSTFSFLNDVSHISLLSAIPSDKSEDYLSQGIEKLLNGFVPEREDKEYSVLVLAESITQEGIREIINGFEQMATAITPYSTHQFQMGKNDSESNGEMKSTTDTTGVSHAISKTHSINIGANVGRGMTSTSGVNTAQTLSESDTNTISEGTAEGETDSDTKSSSEANTENKSSSKGSSDTAGGSVGGSATTTVGTSVGTSFGTSTGVSGGIGFVNADTNFNSSVNTSVNTSLATTLSASANYSHGWNRSETIGTAKTLTTNVAKTLAKSVTRSLTNSVARTVGKSLTEGAFSSVAKMLSFGLSGGYGYSWGKIDTDSESKSLTDGTNHNVTLGSSENTTYTYKSYQVSDLLSNLEENIKRLNESKSTGLWKTATYVFSKNGTTARSVANYLKGITQGEESFIETAKIFDWKEEKTEENAENVEKTQFAEIKEYLTHFIHPIFSNSNDLFFSEIQKNDLKKEVENAINEEKLIEDATKTECIEQLSKEIQALQSNLYNILITPTTNLSTTELAKIFSLPSHSLPGLPVLECAEFGRTVASYDEKLQKENFEEMAEIELGKIFHMHHKEDLAVNLNLKSLSSHTFITGSTGSGKSNTVYKILNEAKTKGKKFLVVEPAKGEYKNIFGNMADVNVYGTNPQLTQLLRINPFSFPEKIHILEHLDRLIEIFNVCWPMYAAMPAVLKEAVEKSYEDAGWDLVESKNAFGENLYPTFADVARNIKLIIDSSEYDAENKGAYKGSLLTRLKSLSNGINGLIFTVDEIENQKLFDENVIVDLSRVGSTETKSLIMGLLVLKLQEYRMTCGKMNANLEHLTVLEEAHNLLKITSTEQSAESANLLGKSVEMLTNAIAEMRTYGEGFIIADQAPALLDMAVIRNTNTKIIMRLPDLDDRRLVGKAAALNDDQIDELAKLPLGVAAVYQNEWVEAVLCKVEKANVEETVYENKAEEKPCTMQKRLEMTKALCNISSKNHILIEEFAKIDVDFKKFAKENLGGTLYADFCKYKNSSFEKPNYDNLSKIVSKLLPEFTKILKSSALKFPSNIILWRDELQKEIEKVLSEVNLKVERELRDNILQCILQNYVVFELNKTELLNELNPRKSGAI